MSLRVEDRGPARWLIIDRPKARNALDAEVTRRLIEELGRAESEAAQAEGGGARARPVVITGAGPVFCAGGDLSSIGEGGFVTQHEGRGLYAELLQRITGSSAPTIARVQGPVRGGGVGLALACDLIVAAEGASFATPELKVGLFPMMVAALLMRCLPRKEAMALLLGGPPMSAARAAELGLVNGLAADEEGLDARVGELAEELAGVSPAVLALGKQALRMTEDMPLREALEVLNGWLSLNLQTQDAREGIAAFLGKRRPQWEGR